jgi:hypothetical protein
MARSHDTLKCEQVYIFPFLGANMPAFKTILVLGFLCCCFVAGRSAFAVSANNIVSIDQTAEPATLTPLVASATAEPATLTPLVASATAEPTLPAATAEPTLPAATQPMPTATLVSATAVVVPTVITANGGPPSAGDLPIPDQPIAEAPLSLAQRVSVSSASIGMAVQYTIQISGSRPGVAVEVRSSLPGELDIISIAASSGECRGTNQIICHLTLGQESGLIIVQARVSNRAIAGTQLAAQAIAQDEASFTAASEMTILAIVGAPAAALAGDQAQADPPASSPSQPDAPASSPDTAPSQPAAPALPAVPAEQNEPVRGSDIVANPADSAPAEHTAPLIGIAEPAYQPAANNPVAAANNPVAAANNPVAAGSAAIPDRGPQYAASTLPNTATTGVYAGWLVGLLGFAGIAYGLRRIRRAALLLDDRRLEQLQPLIGAMQRAMRKK